MTRQGFMRKAATFVLAATLALMAVPAMAFGLPDANAKGSITVHKLSAMKVSDDVQTGNEITDTSSYGKPLAGATFAVTKIDLPTLANGVSFTGSPVVEVDASGAVTAVKFSTTNGEITQSTTGTVSTAVTTDAKGVAKFENLDQGYYALVETVTPAGHEPSVPTLITVPMTKTDGSGYLYNVHVYPKNLVNDGLITKVLDNGTSLNVPTGDFSWTVDAAFRAVNAGSADYVLGDLRTGNQGSYTYGSFSVTDTMDKFLAYKSSEVSFIGQNGDPLTEVVLVEDTDYTVDTTTVEGSVTWKLTSVGIDKAIANDAAKLRVVVTTTMGSIAESGIPTAMVNKASYAMTPAGGSTSGGGETPEVPAYKANVQVNKLFSAEAQKLIDAGTITKADIAFKLATNEAGTTFVKDVKGADLVATTDADGKASFSGVPYDNANGNTYYLVETTTKPGLHLKQNVIKVELAASQGANPTADYTVTAEVTNYAQTETDPDSPVFQLPLTGGMGTVLFTVVGVALMAGAVFLVMRSRRKKA